MNSEFEYKYVALGLIVVAVAIRMYFIGEEICRKRFPAIPPVVGGISAVVVIGLASLLVYLSV